MTVIEKIVAKAVWPKIDAPIEAHGHVPATIIEFKQREAYDAAHNIITALEEAGYRIVPVELTDKMILAGLDALSITHAWHSEPAMRNIHRAFLEASRLDADRAD